MDISGNNRYQLLFMDDDLVLSPAQIESTILNKQTNSSASIRKPTLTIESKTVHVEKENKSGALNNNDTANKKSVAIHSEPKARSSGNASNKKNQLVMGGPRRTTESENGEVCQQRNVQRNLREFGSEQLEPRQFRDRDNRGFLRNRDGVSRGGKREFDRQSGSDKTGVKSIDKRDGAGAHNWGSVKQEIDDINKSTTDATLTDKEESFNENVEQPVSQEEEEKIKELTLDEWKALRGERTKPHYNIRKPNEGEDISQWKKMVVLNKKKEGDGEEEYEYDPSMYPQRVGRLQRIVDIQFNFSDGCRSGGVFGRRRWRGFRCGGDSKGRRDEGDRLPIQQRDSGERQQKRSTLNYFEVDDERQFPTLS